jgi:hypothetical protein
MKRNALGVFSGSMASAVTIALATALISLMVAGPSRAQATPEQRSSDVQAFNGPESAAAPALATADQPAVSGVELTTTTTPATAATPASPQVGEPASDWHFAVSPYLWLPGVHGTIGALDHDVSVHASPGDLLSHFRFGLMGLVDTRYKRVVMPLDMMWVRFGDSRALPLTDEAVSANLKASEFILTPKIGYRVIDSKIVKIDALAGFRYWHFGQSLHLSSSSTTLRFSSSQNWVDPLVGGRITANLSPKVEVTIAGDVGGWGTGSQLEYQVVGALGYRIKPAVVLQVGYRYLDVDYRSGGSIIDMATSGVIIGATFMLK